jgi:hypothetical protein
MNLDEAIRQLTEYCARRGVIVLRGDTTFGDSNSFVPEITVLSTPDRTRIHWVWIESTDGTNSIGACFRYRQPRISYGAKVAARPVGSVQWLDRLPSP